MTFPDDGSSKRDHLEQGRLAAAGRSEQRELAAADREVGPLDGDEVPELRTHCFEDDHVPVGEPVTPRRRVRHLGTACRPRRPVIRRGS
jgi:hypothetical protein